jgi:hypothetical protein
MARLQAIADCFNALGSGFLTNISRKLPLINGGNYFSTSIAQAVEALVTSEINRI